MVVLHICLLSMRKLSCRVNTASWLGSFAAASPARVCEEREGGSKQTPADSSVPLSPGFPGLCSLGMTETGQKTVAEACVLCCGCCELSKHHLLKALIALGT